MSQIQKWSHLCDAAHWNLSDKRTSEQVDVKDAFPMYLLLFHHRLCGLLCCSSHQNFSHCQFHLIICAHKEPFAPKIRVWTSSQSDLLLSYVSNTSRCPLELTAELSGGADVAWKAASLSPSSNSSLRSSCKEDISHL